MISDDEYLERVVAGIQQATNDAAEVNWNEIINGRQFDVVVRFTLASLRYLVLFEVKNRKRKAEAEDLDAFVTKSRDQKANKAVFVNVAGYQSGAQIIAERHGIELFTVNFDHNIAELPSTATHIVTIKKDAPPEPPTISISGPALVINILDVKLYFTDGKEYDLPSEATQLEYYLAKTTFPNGQALEPTLVQKIGQPNIELGEERVKIVKIRLPKVVTPPDDYYFPAGKLNKIKCTIRLTEVRLLSGNTRIEPTALQHPVIYKNALTKEELVFRLDQLPLGDRHIKVGSFYMAMHPLMYYYCEKVEHELVTWILVESFQNGEKIQGKFTQKIKYANLYITVRDKKTLERLQRRLADYCSLS